ncbi:hypothetical protein OBBRIDRAFT_807358 [Obba rivulosa]|uniref:CxC2-like cysteine cluster KDZ transposase-associated domain-containing protein n=1 Tax=Obba rivulosa TaxID=1052685 RepID=A0A8E2DG80_9APHY|nr:hypothetical protein OBBRIDRAFT_807358 [Obba rivulosa]
MFDDLPLWAPPMGAHGNLLAPRKAMRSPRRCNGKAGQAGHLSSIFQEPKKRGKPDAVSTTARYNHWGSLCPTSSLEPALSPIPARSSQYPTLLLPSTLEVTGMSQHCEPKTTSQIKARQMSKNKLPCSVRLAQFVMYWAKRALDTWLEREQAPSGAGCEACGTVLACERDKSDQGDGSQAAYRCMDCFLPRLFCKECVIATHVHNPFHRIEGWNGRQGFWERRSLGQLGMTVNLGHGGKKCPVALPEVHRMVVVHTHGIDEVGVHFCVCMMDELEDTPHALQLIAHGMWPGSWEKSMTAFTIEVLKDFHLLSLQSQMMAQDFYQYLRRQTDNIDPRSVADRYRELLFAMQEFIWLRAVKRAGLEPCRHMPPGSLVVLCPACPQPEMNMHLLWKERPEHLRISIEAADRFLDALHHTMDGNFQQNQREKPSDPNDFALTEGAAYFADVHDFATYQKSMGPLERKPSTCHKFGTIGYGGYGGRVSGTMQVFLHISGYDINCQYRKNFWKRMEWFRKNRGLMNSIKHVQFPKTLSVIGKFHLPAHNAACRYKFSYYWMPGAAMTDGEAPERIWAVLNGLAAHTQEMAAGHRHDIINDHHSDMNVRRTHTMARNLRVKHEEATAEAECIREELEKLEAKLPPEKVAEWKQQEGEYLRKVVDLATHEGLENPYELQKETALSQKQILAHLNQESGATGQKFERHGLIGVLEEGIELQELRYELTIGRELRECGEVNELSNELHVKLERLQNQLDVWRELRDLFLHPMVSGAWAELQGAGVDRDEEQVPIDSDKSRDGWRPVPGSTCGDEWEGVNGLWIELPLSYSARIIRCESMKEAVDIERRLREGQANDALAEFSLKEHQRKETTGIEAMMRSQRQIQKQSEAIDRAADMYTRAHTALLTLTEKTDECRYRALEAGDIVAFMMRGQVIGESRKASSWIWEDCSWLDNTEEGAVKNFVKNAIRVHWFRRAALKTRWDEQKLLIEEEMRRMLRFFQHWQQHWLLMSDEEVRNGRRGHAAYGLNCVGIGKDLPTLNSAIVDHSDASIIISEINLLAYVIGTLLCVNARMLGKVMVQI